MKKQNFTLVELLTVIAIIGILAGILLPALGMVKENAKHNQALTEAKTISMAIKSFYNDYKYLPWKPTSSMDVVIYSNDDAKATASVATTDAVASEEKALCTDYLDLFDRLCCSNLKGDSGIDATSPSANSKAYNPQKKKYLNPPSSYFATEATAKGFRDPWGRSYIVYLDTDYDQKIDISSTKLTGTGVAVIPDIVAVLSFGKSGLSKVSEVTDANRVEIAASWQ